MVVCCSAQGAGATIPTPTRTCLTVLPRCASLVVVVAQGIKVMFIASGSASVHCIAGDINGVCYTWGRNEVRLNVGFVEGGGCNGVSWNFTGLWLGHFRCCGGVSWHFLGGGVGVGGGRAWWAATPSATPGAALR
jgi:hypothetical protein